MAQDPFDKYRVKEDEEDDFSKYLAPEMSEPDPVIEEPKSILKRAYEGLTSPLTNLPSRIANTVAEPMMSYGENGSGMLNKGALYGGAFLSSLGNVADQMTSPVDLAATVLSGGASMAGKRGALSLAEGLNTGARLTSIPAITHGLSEVVDGNPAGLVEAGFGALGARGQKFNPEVAQDLAPIVNSAERPRLSKPIIPEMPVVNEVAETIPTQTVAQELPATSQLELPQVAESIPQKRLDVPTLDYSPSSEMRARNILKTAGVEDLDGLSNKQIIEMAEQSKPGHQKPKIKVKFDPETNSLIPDNDDPVTVNVLKSAKTNKPIPQQERISPNTEVEFPDPNEMADASQPYFEGLFPELPKSTARSYPPEVMKMMRQDAIPGTQSKDAYKQMVPGGKPSEAPDVTKLQEYLSIPRAMQSMWDLSFPLRQGIGLVHTKGWWKAWPDMIKSAGDEGAYRAVMDSIAERPNFRGMKAADGSIKKSFAQEAGLAVSDLSSLSKREENLGSGLAEKYVPGLRASNRAYTAFANKLRADTFDSLIADAEKSGLNPKGNMELAKSIADYVNNASGRGNLGTWEPAATKLNNLLFSPRLIASRAQMMNPANYMFADPFVRKQYWKSMAAMVGAYSTFTALNHVAGGTTGTDDPTSSEFGRTKVGNTRFDPSGGLLPYITLFARLGKGTVDKLKGDDDGRYTGKFGAPTPMGDLGSFFGNKAAPALSMAMRFSNANENRPLEVGDQALRMFTPIMLQDLSELLKEDPSMAPFGIAQSMIGVGTNTYENGEPPERLLPGALDPLKNRDFSIPRSFRR